jgi:eukaryotic-like serine/threonine-protein kinase
VPLSAGARLGPYEIRGLVGAGGMGEVYRAYDPRLDRLVALKVVPDDIAGDPRRRERFRREAHAIAALTHPHIVTVHSAEDLEGHLVLVMELVEGKTLAELLPSGGMPLPRLVKIAVQIADALGAAHDRGIIHRDLKPRNVMVTGDGRVKVLDFGLAKLRDAREGEPGSQHDTASLYELTGEGRIVGTAAYMSPEQAEGRRLDHRTDLFSLGIVLYEMASGERPFTGESVVSVLSSILRDVPRPLADLNPRLPREFTRIVRRCLAKDPDERYQSAKDLRLDLEDLRLDLSSGEQAAQEPGAGPRSKRTFALVGLLVAAAGAAAAAVAWPLLRDATRSPRVVLTGADRLTAEPGMESAPSLSPDGQWVVYSRSSGALHDIYLQAVGGERPVNLTAESRAGNGQAAFSPDGSRIAFRSSRAGGGVFVMGRTGELVRQVTDKGHWPTWSPDGTRLAISSEPTIDIPYTYAGGASVWTVEIESGRRTRLTDLDGTQPSWSPHDQRIAFWGVDPATQHRDIWTVPVRGGAAVRVTNDAATDATPIWSSDGRYLYFSSSRGGTMNLWRVPIDEATGQTRGPLEPVTVPAENAVHPSISRDGRRLAYLASSWTSSVYAFGFDPVAGVLAAAPPRWLFGGPHHWSMMRVSPNGERIASVRAGQQQDLVVTSADGSGAQRLTNDAVGVRCPFWSPDGRSIVLLSTRRGDKDLIFVEPDAGRTRRVSDLPSTGLVGCPAWSPDGSRISVVQGPSDPAVLVFDPRTPMAAQQVERLPPHPAGPFYPRAWSPDGTRLTGTVGYMLVLYDVRARRYLDVAGPRLVAASPIEWLPDGRRLIAMSEGRLLLLIDTATGAARSFYESTPDVIRSFAVSWPRREIYVSRGPEEADVWIAAIDSQ